MLLLLASISLGAILSVSSQRHVEYILVINRSTAFSHLVSTNPVARFYGLRGKNKFLRGKIFLSIVFLKQYFLGTKFGWQKEKIGRNCPKRPPWLRACDVTQR